MKIRSVQVLSFERQLDGRAYNPVFRWHERRAPLIVVRTDNGAMGVGEAWAGYAAHEPVLEALARIAPSLIGHTVKDPLNAAKAIALFPDGVVAPSAQAAALSAIDIALWDACAQERGVPVWRLLGGTKETAPVYASGGLYRDDYSIADLAAEMTGYIERGFRAVKMKVAGLSLQQDLTRVRAVRDAIGPDVVLWVDAVNQLSVDTATTWCAAFAAMDVAAIQAPIPFADVAGMAELNRNVMPVIAAESEFRTEAFDALLQYKAVSHLQFCLPLCGGFSGARALDQKAHAMGIATTPQCYSTSIAQAAALHFAAAHPNVICAEYHGYHDHLQALYKGRTGQVADGTASAGSLPGLGVAVPDLGRQSDGSLVGLYYACG